MGRNILLFILYGDVNYEEKIDEHQNSLSFTKKNDSSRLPARYKSEHYLETVFSYLRQDVSEVTLIVR